MIRSIMYSLKSISYLYNSIIRNALILILCLSISYSSRAQTNLNITAPSNLELNCLNVDFTIITSWLKDYAVTNNCQGNIRVTNNFDGQLPDVCGQPKFVKWIVTNECNQIDSAGSTITINTDLEAFGFEICPNNITVFADTMSCGRTVIFPEPYARNCFGQMSTRQVRNSNSFLKTSGDEFEIGDTEIVYIAEDDCNKRDTCRFDIVVISSEDLVNVYCPDDEVMRVCSNIDGCGWNSEGDLIRPGSTFLDCEVADISYRIQLPDGETITSQILEDDDGDATGYVFPLGQSLLCYIINNNGGSTTCCSNIIVEDCSPPTIICPGIANFTCDLAQDNMAFDEWLGQAIIRDNCDRTSTVRPVVLDTVGVCGSDEIIEYLFISSDNVGNEKACVTSVNLTDDVGPEITVARLPDEIVECKGIVRNQELLIEWLGRDGGFNDSHVINNCPSEVTWSFDPTTTTFEILPSACSSNTGFYDVAFFATDRCGNQSNTARARLVFEDTTPPSVTFPDSLTLDCDLNNLENSVRNLLNDVVAIDSCSQYSIESSFDINLVECELGDNELEVNFTATDECGNESVTTAMIILTKFDRSTISAPDDLIVRCGQDIDSLINDWLDAYTVEAKCDSVTVINNYDASMIDICGSVQQVIWILRDTCGASQTSSSLLSILDDTNPPVFLNCPVNTIIDVNNSDCTANFIFDFPDVEDCSRENISIKQVLPPAGQPIFTSGSDFPIGTTDIIFTATDNCQNMSTCEFSVTVREDAVCEQGALSLMGKIRDSNGENVSNVRLTLNADLPEYPRSNFSGNNGEYSFENLPPRFDYGLTLEIEDEISNGLSTVDLVQIRNHVLGFNLFTSSLQVIAADANNDETLSAVDLVVLQNIIIGFQDSFPNGNPWRFVRQGEINSSTLIPWPQIDVFNFPNITRNLIEDFVAIKVGDVNFSADVNLKSNTEVRQQDLNIELSDVDLVKGESYEISFDLHSEKDLKGFQMGLKLNGILINDIQSENFVITDKNKRLDGDIFLVNAYESNILNSAHNTGGLFVIQFEATKNVRLSRALSIDSQLLSSEVYISENIEVHSLNLSFSQKTALSNIQVVPNPFSTNALIKFDNAKAGYTTLTVFDPSGIVYYKSNQYFPKGTTSFIINQSDIPKNGIFFYTLESDGQKNMGKFICTH